MNLAYHYPPIYWATAVITVDAGALDDEDNSGSNTNYAKVAAAIGRVQSEGYTVELPNINKAEFSFTPDAKNNAIIYGLKGITEINEELAKRIIKERPYDSVEDFIIKIQPQKKQMINLIKAGAFDAFGEKRIIMNNYLLSITPKKARITLQNINSLIEYNLIPKNLHNYIKLYNFNKYLKRSETPQGFKIDARAAAFLNTNYPSLDFGLGFLSVKEWKKAYEKDMNVLKIWLKENEENLINEIQKKEMDFLWQQYCQGTNSAWEMEVLGFYYSGHELSNANIKMDDLLTMEDGNFKTNQQIAGTVLGKDAYKHTITLLTTKGVVSLKFGNEQFAKYNKTISEVKNDTKKVLEKSWFIKGTLLIAQGFKSGEVFRVKSLSRIVSVDDLGKVKSTKYRYGE